MDSKELTRLALTVQVVKAKVLAADVAVREALAARLDAGERVPGRIGDAKIGAATKTDPMATAKVVDGNAFRAWVKANRPEEIVTVEAVNSAFEKALLKIVGECGGMTTEDGEVFDVPGVQIVPGVPQLRVVPDEGADRVIADAIAADGLSLTELLDAVSMKALER